MEKEEIKNNDLQISDDQEKIKNFLDFLESDKWLSSEAKRKMYLFNNICSREYKKNEFSTIEDVIRILTSEIIDAFGFGDDLEAFIEIYGEHKYYEYEDKKYAIYHKIGGEHHGLGRRIRNNFGLWGEKSIIVAYAETKERYQDSYYHPDCLSGEIMV